MFDFDSPLYIRNAAGTTIVSINGAGRLKSETLVATGAITSGGNDVLTTATGYTQSQIDTHTQAPHCRVAVIFSRDHHSLRNDRLICL